MDEDRKRRRRWLAERIDGLAPEEIERLAAAVEIIEGLATR
jgi:hypothetical protein